MSERRDILAHRTYVVRVSRDDSGRIRGVVVRVATGERLPFADVDLAGPLLRDIIEADLSQPGPHGSDAPP